MKDDDVEGVIESYGWKGMDEPRPVRNEATRTMYREDVAVSVE